MNPLMSNSKGLTSEETNTTPNINVKFVRFEPIAVALARFACPRFTATRLRLNSGKEVPIAMSSAPITIGEIPNTEAISRPDETVNRADIAMIAVPIPILAKS